jgi:hypothetical protein
MPVGSNARRKGIGWKVPEAFQRSEIAGWEGWLAPAQSALLSTLNGREIERGQAALPNLQSTQLESLRLSVSSDSYYVASTG